MGSKPKGLSASRAAAILGLNSFQSPFEVWQRIMEERQPGFNAERGYLMPEEPDNAPIRWGTAFEQAIIGLAEFERGIIEDQEGFFDVFNEVQIKGLSVGLTTTYDMCKLTCHIDGRYQDGTLHEGKTTSFFTWKEKWGEPGTDKIPQEYQVQVQHQMICTGADEAVVSVLVFPKRVEEFEELGWEVGQFNCGGWFIDRPKSQGGASTRIDDWASTLSEMGYLHQYPVKANLQLQERLKQLYAEWWQAHVIEETPPTEGMTYDDVRRMIPEPVGTVVLDDQTARQFKEYKDIGKEIGKSGQLSKRRDQLKVDLLQKISNYGATKDDESEKKWIFRDEQGNKVGQYDGKTFRT